MAAPDGPATPGRPDDDTRGDRAPSADRPDPEAPGNFVDDDEAADVPEPNEPG